MKEQSSIIGIDLGGTKTAMTLFEEDQKLLSTGMAFDMLVGLMLSHNNIKFIHW